MSVCVCVGGGVGSDVMEALSFYVGAFYDSLVYSNDRKTLGMKQSIPYEHKKITRGSFESEWNLSEMRLMLVITRCNFLA